LREDTIAAIATPLGEGGIGIVRISGPEGIEIVNKIFQSPKNIDLKKVPTYKAHYGHIYNPESKQVIDEVIVLIMRSPRSYTREDVVEIHCHGGIMPLRQVFALVIAKGARIAEPGEFTKRAFLNGRLDLAQAEAVIDVIRAKTDVGLQVAMGQLGGHLSKTISYLQDQLLSLLAQIEVSIDFPEHDLPDVTKEEILKGSYTVASRIKELLATAHQGKVLREGLRTVIVGKPNVGKSSLLNALLQEDRALVTNIPGTTRDIIEEIINIEGIPLKIIDTAGIRESNDLVEKLGIEQAKRFYAAADLVLMMLDASAGWTKEDQIIVDMLGEKTAIVLINKIDIGNKISAEEVKRKIPGQEVLCISVKEQKGFDQLRSIIKQKVFQGEIVIGESNIVSNVRHQEALDRAYKHLQEVINALTVGITVDLAAIDLHAAWESLGEITGETMGEEVINRIFSDFCLGK
jgi:tRNA modification GTPase